MKFKANKIILEYGEIEMYLHESSDPIPPEVIWGCEFVYNSTHYYEDTIFADDEFYTLEEAMEWYNSTVEKYVVKPLAETTQNIQLLVAEDSYLNG